MINVYEFSALVITATVVTGILYIVCTTKIRVNATFKDSTRFAETLEKIKEKVQGIMPVTERFCEKVVELESRIEALEKNK